MKTSKNPAEQENTLLDSPDKPPVALVTTIIVVTFLFVFVSWFFVEAVLFQVTDRMQVKENTGMANDILVSYLKEQESYLNSYKKLDNGKYKIPIEQAMAQVINTQKGNK